MAQKKIASLNAGELLNDYGGRKKNGLISGHMLKFWAN